MIWVKYVFLCRSSFKNSQKRQKTISIPHWYRYGLSKNEQSKFGLIPWGGEGLLKSSANKTLLGSGLMTLGLQAWRVVKPSNNKNGIHSKQIHANMLKICVVTQMYSHSNDPGRILTQDVNSSNITKYFRPTINQNEILHITVIFFL